MLFNGGVNFKKEERLHGGQKMPIKEIRLFLSKRYSARVIQKIFCLFTFPAQCSFEDYLCTIE